MKTSHVTQSHRSIVERKIRDMKLHAITQGGKIEKIEKSEDELDVALSLSNLKELFRQKLSETIPAKGPYVANSHIISPNLDLPLKIPKATTLDAPSLAPHIKAFHIFSVSIRNRLHAQVFDEKVDSLFTGRVRVRAQSLVDGCNVLQVRFQGLADDSWRVCATVGAMMRADNYFCYFDISKDGVVTHNICACKAGYVSHHTSSSCVFFCHDYVIKCPLTFPGLVNALTLVPR